MARFDTSKTCRTSRKAPGSRQIGQVKLDKLAALSPWVVQIPRKILPTSRENRPIRASSAQF